MRRKRIDYNLKTTNIKTTNTNHYFSKIIKYSIYFLLSCSGVCQDFGAAVIAPAAELLDADFEEGLRRGARTVLLGIRIHRCAVHWVYTV